MIFKTLLLPLLLQAIATPEQYGRSSSVGSDHQHEWVKLDDIKDGSVWGDTNPAGRVTAGQEVYPIVAMRIVFNPGTALWAKVEAMQAIDCDQNKIAAFTGIVPLYPRQVDKMPEFRSWPNPDNEGVQQLMRAVCGENWKP